MAFNLIIENISLKEFKAWAGGKDRLDEIIELGLCDAAEDFINEIFPDGITDTKLNDWLWFEADEWIAEQTGIPLE